MNRIPNFNTALSQILRMRREQAGLTQALLARKIGGSESYIKTLEGGKQTPTMTVFILLAEACGVDARELLDEVLRQLTYISRKET